MSFLKWFWRTILFVFLFLEFSPFQVSALNCHVCDHGAKCSSKPCEDDPMLGPQICSKSTTEGKTMRSCAPKAVIVKLGVEIGGKCKEVSVSDVSSAGQAVLMEKVSSGGVNEGGGNGGMPNLPPGAGAILEKLKAFGMTEQEISDIQQKMASGEMTQEELFALMQTKMANFAGGSGRTLMGMGRAADSKLLLCVCDKTDCNSQGSDGSGALRSISEFVFGIAIFSSVSVGWILLRL